MTNKIRLNRFLAMSGLASRRKTEEYIITGRIDVNGQTVTSLGVMIDPDNDRVELDGEVLRFEEKVYFLLHKPAGYITTVSDDKKRPTVMELIKTSKRIYTVGRLDYDTTGVLILSNDGDFANAMLHPSNKIMRTYQAKLDKPFDLAHIEPLKKGVSIEGGKGKFESVAIDRKNNRLVTIECTEGRNLFVKRMFRKMDYFVDKLHRSKFAGFTINDLAPGAYRSISLLEIKDVLQKYSRS
jgi:23S rRNA pseudouridine2605 synthase